MNLNEVIPVEGGMHVEEAEDMHELVDNGGVCEAAHADGAASEVHGVDAARDPVADVRVAAVWDTL